MGDANFMGGLLGGLSSSMQKQQEFTQKQEYQKSLIEINKLHGKLFEAQARAAELKSQGLPQSLIDAMNATEKDAQNVASLATQGPAPALPQQGQVAQAPQAPWWGPGSLPRQTAQGQITIPGDPANNISVRQNNPFNIKGGANYPGSIGSGTRGFSIFETPEAGYQAGIDLIAKYQSGKGPVPQGATISQMGQKYEGSTSQNIQNWVKNVSSYLKVNPETPIASIPTLQLAAAISNAESSTQAPQFIAQPQSPAPMQPPGQQLITPNFPKPTGISKMKLGDRLALDVYFKQAYDLDTKFRETKGKYRLHGTPEAGYQIINEESGQIVTLPPTQQKLSRYNFTTQTGAEGIGFAPDTLRTPVGGGAGGAGGGAGPVIQTKPGVQDMITPVPENIKTELQKSEDSLRGLQTMRKMVNSVGDDAFGFWAATKHKVYQSEEDPLKAIARSGYELLGKAPTPEQTTFRVELEKFNSNLRYLLYAGNLTPQEAERYQKQALAATTKSQFIAVLDSMENAIKAKMQDRIIEGAGTQSQNLQRRAGQSLAVPPSINPQSTRGMQVPPKLPSKAGQPFMENGVKKMIGPDGKKYRWVD